MLMRELVRFRCAWLPWAVLVQSAALWRVILSRLRFVLRYGTTVLRGLMVRTVSTCGCDRQTWFCRFMCGLEIVLWFLAVLQVQVV